MTNRKRGCNLIKVRQETEKEKMDVTGPAQTPPDPNARRRFRGHPTEHVLAAAYRILCRHGLTIEKIDTCFRNPGLLDFQVVINVQVTDGKREDARKAFEALSKRLPHLEITFVSGDETIKAKAGILQ